MFTMKHKEQFKESVRKANSEGKQHVDTKLPETKYVPKFKLDDKPAKPAENPFKAQGKPALKTAPSAKTEQVTSPPEAKTEVKKLSLKPKSTPVEKPEVKIEFKKKPKVLNKDSWVADRAVTEFEPKKRLTIDIPLQMHKNFKSYCSNLETSMGEEITRLIEIALKT